MKKAQSLDPETSATFMENSPYRHIICVHAFHSHIHQLETHDCSLYIVPGQLRLSTNFNYRCVYSQSGSMTRKLAAQPIRPHSQDHAHACMYANYAPVNKPSYTPTGIVRKLFQIKKEIIADVC